MKKKFIYPIACLCISAVAVAQPVIQNGNNLPAAGFSSKISIAQGTIAPGNGGAGLTWDFTSLPATQVALFEIVDPASSAYAGTFPSANFCMKITPTGGSNSIYSYYVSTASKLESLTDNWPAGNKNYTPNPKTRIPYPFNFGNSAVDTFQYIGGSVHTVKVTYDAYGTLKLPEGSFDDIIRITHEFGPGDYTMVWYTLNPLLPKLTYDGNNNEYTIMEATTTGVNKVKASSISLYPNPAQDKVHVFIPSGQSVNMQIFCLGDAKAVFEQSFGAGPADIDVSTLNSGIYVYKIISEEGEISCGKLLIK